MSKRNKHSCSSFSNETYLGFEVSVSNQRKGTKFKAKGAYCRRDNGGPSPAGRMITDRLNKACIILSKRAFL